MDVTLPKSFVHIIPLGYEIDRAIRPFDSEPASRVYLLTMKQMEKYNTPEEIQMTKRERHFETQVKEHLIKRGIDVIIYQIDMFDIIDVMNSVASIINYEKKSGSIIKVNMSACGRIAAFAATLAAMAQNVTLYYVRADKYAEKEDDVSCHGLSICEQKRIWELERIPLALPKKIQMTVLILLAHTDNGLYTWEIVDYLIKNRDPGYSESFRSKQRDEMRKLQRRYHTRLNKSALAPLEYAGYITQEKIGRYHRISITSSGKYIVALSGSLPNSGEIDW